uniref:NADH-ubiquinone oxidoreductase chain 1 n=2 Tax=Altica TaxID=131581 RepID=A0A4P8JGP2_9CUCU|nr:NADH dehydrogenase subunit 1 [Altica viridicyanea]QCC71318.1 NADH dehydrogenase subunit 1 [Altica cirsicola]QCC71357.1 NADH dehydrogenase subunit 1 [Altica viridicyanea]QCC71370.1 NADH dehydrogenase subunit 1 [Altica cirsicola]QCC71383.1 NADH dehydrogenase subunit 1 [Altica viridicyanea]QCP68679.1 NADH dehydrogenase subunit 1 [Altica viridicyanea]
MDLILMFISSLILIISVLIGIAFLTLMERKILGYIQIRKGPNKVSFIGIMQPFSDAIKLLVKEQSFPFLSNLSLFYICPMVNLFLSLLLWFCMPFFSNYLSFSYSILFFLSISSVNVYSIMLAGWSSNSNYSLLGCIRSVAQTISYEVSLALIMMSYLFLILSLNLLDFLKFQEYVWFIYLMMPLCFMWIVSSLAETNRSPFDFAEGESELVSGFNVEYSSGGFVMLFLAEYSNILFMSMLCVIMFLGANLFSFMFFIKLVGLSFFWVWVRGTLPRYRYDKLMYLAWKGYLPVALNYLIFFYSMKMFIFILFI